FRRWLRLLLFRFFFFQDLLRHRERGKQQGGGQQDSLLHCFPFVSSGLRALMASAWMGSCISSPSAWYTMRWRATVGLPEKRAEVMESRQWVPPPGRWPAWPACCSLSSTRSRASGSSVARRLRILAATLIGPPAFFHRCTSTAPWPGRRRTPASAPCRRTA